MDLTIDSDADASFAGSKYRKCRATTHRHLVRPHHLALLLYSLALIQMSHLLEDHVISLLYAHGTLSLAERAPSFQYTSSLERLMHTRYVSAMRFLGTPWPAKRPCISASWSQSPGCIHNNWHCWLYNPCGQTWAATSIIGGLCGSRALEPEDGQETFCARKRFCC